jgi:hypothetical protein
MPVIPVNKAVDKKRGAEEEMRLFIRKQINPLIK